MKIGINKLNIKLFHISIGLFSLLNVLFCQPERNKSDSLFTKAQNILNEGNYNEAGKIYESILNENGNSIPALIGLAKSTHLQKNFLKARDIIKDALNIDPQNVYLHYLYAVLIRDIARYNNTINSINPVYSIDEFKKSAENFKWIINRDSLYKDVFYQYSLLFRFKGKYPEALDVNLTQIKLKPKEPEPYCGLIRSFTTAFKYFSHKELESYLNEKKSDIKSYLFCELKRMDGDLESAKIIFEDLINSNTCIPRSLIILSLLRIHANEDTEQKFEEFYWDCIDEISSKVDFKIIFNDIKYLATHKEIMAFDMISTKEDFNKFMDAFWNKRNPAPLLRTNPRILEHYKRILFAEKNYRYDRERFTFLEHKNSNFINYEYTDQGFIYIRHGKPDDKMQTAYTKLSETPDNTVIGDAKWREEQADHSNYKSETDIMESVLTDNKLFNSSVMETPLCESWLYNATDETPKMIFHFLGGEKNLIPVILERHVLEDIRSWDKQISDYLWDTDESRVDNHPPNKIKPKSKINKDMRLLFSTEVDNHIKKIYEQGTKNIKTGLSEEHSSWNKDMVNCDLPNGIYSFRGSKNKTMLELIYLIPTSDIFKSTQGTPNFLKIENGFGIYDKNWNNAIIKTDTLLVQKSNKEQDSFLKIFHFEMEPDSCGLSIFYHPLNTKIYGNFKNSLGIKNYSLAGLKISDIMPGYKTDKITMTGAFSKKDINIIPLVEKKYSLNQPLTLYYEIYNLVKNLDGKTVFSIEYNFKYIGEDQNLITSVFGKAKTNSISSEYNRFGNNETSKENITFDINKLIPGKYVIEITVKDINERKTEKRSCEIELY